MHRRILWLLIGGLILACSPDDKLTDFPVPTGQYKVGNTALILNIPGEKGKPRQLPVDVWIPTRNTDGDYTVGYLRDSLLKDAMSSEGYLNLQREILSGWDSLILPAHKVKLQQIIPFKWPLILLSPGFGMNRINYSLICIELASHGFIVMAVDHPGTSFTATPEGGTLAVEPNAGGPLGKIKEIQNDVRLILKELESKPEWERLIDWNKVGWIGHSIGGAAAVLVNPGELPVKAAVNMDGHLFKKASDIVLKVPSMAILQRPIFINGRVPDSLRQERSDYWKEISSQSKSLVSVYNLEGYFHLDFSDIPLIIPDSLRVKAGGTLAPKRGHQILSELLIGFFNKHLKSYHINYSNTVSYPELNSEFIP